MPSTVFGQTPPPSGTIIYFNDSVSNIPSGWVFCDGNNGTPDLRDTFQKSIPDTSTAPGSVVGQHSLTLTEAQMPSHDHSIPSTDGVGDHNHGINSTEGVYDSSAGPADGFENNEGSMTTATGGGHSHGLTVSSSGSGNAIDNRPSFVKYVPIMKV